MSRKFKTVSDMRIFLDWKLNVSSLETSVFQVLLDALMKTFSVLFMIMFSQL